MIQAVGEETRFEEEITALAADDPFACRIISLYRCYPPRLVFVDYWLIRDDESGKTTGAATRNGSNFILFLTESADLDEVSSFMRIAGASGIICSGAYKLDLSRESHTGPVLVRNERIEVPDEGARFLLPDIKTAYELIAGCADENFRPPVFEDFYVERFFGEQPDEKDLSILQLAAGQLRFADIHSSPTAQHIDSFLKELISHI